MSFNSISWSTESSSNVNDVTAFCLINGSCNISNVNCFWTLILPSDAITVIVIGSPELL